MIQKVPICKERRRRRRGGGGIYENQNKCQRDFGRKQKETPERSQHLGIVDFHYYLIQIQTKGQQKQAFEGNDSKAVHNQTVPYCAALLAGA